MKSFFSSLLVLVLFVSIPLTSQAQTHGVKWYPFSLALNKLGLQYEYYLGDNKSITGDIGIRRINLDTDGTISDQTGVDGAVIGLQINPAFRFYTGQNEEPSGFYFAPGLRFTRTTLNADIDDIDFDGEFDIRYSTVGITFDIGTQWLIADRVTIDWNFLGIGFQTGPISFSNSELTEADAEEIANDLNSDLEAPVGNPVFEADGNRVRTGLLLPILRSRLAVGVVF